MALKDYDYDSIIAQLRAIPEENYRPRHKEMIEIIIHGLENQWRIHWINDKLWENHYSNLASIFIYHNIKPYKQ